MPIAINGSGTVTGISVGGLPDGIVDADMLAADSVTDGKLNISGEVKAWVHFRGTGTVTILANFNVSSITDEAVGVYTVNIDTDMANVNYCAVVTTGYSSNNIQTSQNSQLFQHSTKTVGSFKIRQGNSENNSNDDADDVNAVVFGD